ncbi:hypothetical protein [Vibrio splendidus]|uniref:hypothetical protein n=1 Tax=Vibrio splendidus TaxID=29497 RepID=UPI00352EBD2E
MKQYKACGCGYRLSDISYWVLGIGYDSRCCLLQFRSGWTNQDPKHKSSRKIERINRVDKEYE